MFKQLLSDCEKFIRDEQSTNLSGMIQALEAKFIAIEPNAGGCTGIVEQFLEAVSAAITKRTRDSNLESEGTASAANLAEEPGRKKAQEEVIDLTTLQGYLELFRLTKNKRTEQILILLRALFREDVRTALRKVFPDQTDNFGFDYKTALLHLHPDSIQGFVLPAEICRKLGEAFLELQKIKEERATSRESEAPKEKLANCSLSYPVAPATTDDKYDPQFPLTFDHLLRTCYGTSEKSKPVELNQRLSGVLKRLAVSVSLKQYKANEECRKWFLEAVHAIVRHDLAKLKAIIEKNSELRPELLSVNCIGVTFDGRETFNPLSPSQQKVNFSLLQFALAVNNIEATEYLLDCDPEALCQEFKDGEVRRSVFLCVESFQAFVTLLINLSRRPVYCMDFLRPIIPQKDEKDRSLVSRIFESDMNWPLEDRIRLARVLVNFIGPEILTGIGLSGRQHSSLLDYISENEEEALEPVITQLLIHAQMRHTSHTSQSAEELPQQVEKLRQNITNEVEPVRTALVTALLAGNNRIVRQITRYFPDLFVRTSHNGLSPVEDFLFEACIQGALNLGKGGGADEKENRIAGIIKQMEMINTVMPELQRRNLWMTIEHNVASSGSLRPQYSGERETTVMNGCRYLKVYELPAPGLRIYQQYVEEVFQRFFTKQGKPSEGLEGRVPNKPNVSDELVAFFVRNFGNYGYVLIKSDTSYEQLSAKAVVALCCMSLEFGSTKSELALRKVILAIALKTRMSRPWQEKSRDFGLSPSNQDLLQQLASLTREGTLDLLRFIAMRFTAQFLPEITRYEEEKNQELSREKLSLSDVCPIFDKIGLTKQALPDLLGDNKEPAFLKVALYWYTRYLFGDISLIKFRTFDGSAFYPGEDWMQRVLSNNKTKLARMFAVVPQLALTDSAASLSLTGGPPTQAKKESIVTTTLCRLGLVSTSAASLPVTGSPATPVKEESIATNTLSRFRLMPSAFTSEEEKLVDQILKAYKRYCTISSPHEFSLNELLGIAKSENFDASAVKLTPVLVKAAIFEVTSVSVVGDTTEQELYNGFNPRNSGPSQGS